MKDTNTTNSLSERVKREFGSLEEATERVTEILEELVKGGYEHTLKALNIEPNSRDAQSVLSQIALTMVAAASKSALLHLSTIVTMDERLPVFTITDLAETFSDEADALAETVAAIKPAIEATANEVMAKTASERVNADDNEADVCGCSACRAEREANKPAYEYKPIPTPATTNGPANVPAGLNVISGKTGNKDVDDLIASLEAEGIKVKAYRIQ